jgi:hypothetical protein
MLKWHEDLIRQMLKLESQKPIPPNVREAVDLAEKCKLQSLQGSASFEIHGLIAIVVGALTRDSVNIVPEKPKTDRPKVEV